MDCSGDIFHSGTVVVDASVGIRTAHMGSEETFKFQLVSGLAAFLSTYHEKRSKRYNELA